MRRAGWWVASAFALAFAGYYGLCALKVQWGWDLLRHAAAVRSFYTDLRAPPHEAMPGAPESVLHSPYHLAVAVLGRALSVTPYRALQLAGLCNLALYVLGVWAFCWAYVADRRWVWTAALLIPIQLFLRDRSWGWSSETDFFTLRYIQAYPSFWGWGVALLLFAEAERFRRNGTQAALHVVLSAAALGALVLGHPLSGGWSFGVLGVHAMWSAVTGSRRAAALGIVTLALAALLALAWPYPPGLSGLAAYRAYQERSTVAEHPLSDLPWVHGLALVAALFSRRHPFVLAAVAATWLALWLSKLAGVTYGERFVFFQLFLLHFLIADLAARAFAGERLAWAYAAAVLAACVLLPRAQLRADPSKRLLSLGELRALPSPERAHYDRYGTLTSSLAGELVLAPPNEAFGVAEIAGARAVVGENACEHPDYWRLHAEVTRFFADTSSRAPPLDVVRETRATRILLLAPDPARAAALESMCGAPLGATARHVLFDARACQR